MRPNKHKEVRKKILGNHFFCQIVSLKINTVNFSGYSSRYEADLAVSVESFNSSSGTNMVSKYSLSHAIFCETVDTVENQIQGQR